MAVDQLRDTVTGRDTITGEGRVHRVFTFDYQLDTEVRTGASSSESETLSELLADPRAEFPIRSGDQVIVTWKPHPRLEGHLLALRITIEKTP